MSMVVPHFAAATRLQDVKEYYFSRKLGEIAQRVAAGADILNLGIGNPDLPPPPGVVEALISDLQQPKAHGYQSYRGTPSLRSAIAGWYANTYGIALEQNEILPLAGSKEGIVHVCQAFLDEGDVMLYPNPGYPAYAAAAQLAKAGSQPYRLPQPGESSDSWINHLSTLSQLAEAKVMFVNTPHMPTGQVLDDEQLLALVAFAKTHGLLLVSDNAYNYYHPAGPQSLLQIEGAREVCVELNSLSKSHHMAGWRLGMLLGRSDVLARALQVKSNLDSGQLRALQAGAVTALSTPADWFAKRNEEITSRRRTGEQLLGSIGCTVIPNQSGLFVWAQLPDGESNAEDFVDQLLDEVEVFMAPGTVFGNAGEGYIRLSLCNDHRTLALAQERLDAAGLTRRSTKAAQR